LESEESSFIRRAGDQEGLALERVKIKKIDLPTSKEE